MYAQFTDKSGKHEIDYFQTLYSERMDNKAPTPPRLRYALLAQARTGSELVSAHLRRQGVGLPLEYFHGASIGLLATRWGCFGPDGTFDFARYCAALERYRTTSSGVFGIKIIMPHLSHVTRGDIGAAAAYLRSFDKVLLMRRRDTLRQAISFMRAMSTGQWHVLPGDGNKRIASADLNLSFARITYCWALVINQDRDMGTLEAMLPQDRLRSVWYEELLDPRVPSGICAWLAGTAVSPQPVAPDHALPLKGDTKEADAIMKAYLDFMGVQSPLEMPTPPARSAAPG